MRLYPPIRNWTETKTGEPARPYLKKDGEAMKETPPHLRTIEEIEQISIPGLVEVLREKDLDTVQAVLWDATG